MRKNSTQLSKEYSDLNTKVLACGARIEARAQELVKQYPDLNIKQDQSSEKIITTQEWVNILDLYSTSTDDPDTDFIITSYLKIISFVEDHIAGQHPHQQQHLF